MEHKIWLGVSAVLVLLIAGADHASANAMALVIEHDVSAVDANHDGRDGVYVLGVNGDGVEIWQETNRCHGLQTTRVHCNPSCPPGALRPCQTDRKLFALPAPADPGPPDVPGAPDPGVPLPDPGVPLPDPGMPLPDPGDVGAPDPGDVGVPDPGDIGVPDPGDLGIPDPGAPPAPPELPPVPPPPDLPIP